MGRNEKGAHVMTTQTLETEPVAVESTALPVVFNLTEARIEQMRAECNGLVCTDKRSYETTRKALSVVRTARTEIEICRKALKKHALEYGKRVDVVAKELTAKVVAIEDPLKAEVKRYETEQERIKAEKEAAERAAIEAELKAQREKEEAERQAIRDAEEARLKSLRDAEEARLVEERKALEAERARLEELQRVENERLEAERAKIAEQQRIEQERIDAERKADDERREKERAELQAYWDAKAAEQARIEAEQQSERDRLQAIQDEIEAKRLEAERIENERLEGIRLEQERECLKMSGTKFRPIVVESIQWIDVSDELPDSGSQVLVCYERNDCLDRDVTIADFDGHEDEPWEVSGELVSFGTVLYWAHVPAGPERS
jgi:hypothetical protein